MRRPWASSSRSIQSWNCISGKTNVSMSLYVCVLLHFVEDAIVLEWCCVPCTNSRWKFCPPFCVVSTQAAIHCADFDLGSLECKLLTPARQRRTLKESPCTSLASLHSGTVDSRYLSICPSPFPHPRCPYAQPVDIPTSMVVACTPPARVLQVAQHGNTRCEQRIHRSQKCNRSGPNS
jgi:hypothetical protein